MCGWGNAAWWRLLLGVVFGLLDAAAAAVEPKAAFLTVVVATWRRSLSPVDVSPSLF